MKGFTGTAAACVLLAALGTLLAGVLWPDQHERRLVVRPRLPAAHQPTAHGLLHLASLKLPDRCLPAMASAAAEDRSGSAMGAAHVCCTRCHAEGKEGAVVTLRAVAALQQSCMACHEARS